MSDGNDGAEQRGEKRELVLEAEPGRYGVELAESTYLSWASFAARWWWDALEEVPGEPMTDSRRVHALRRQVVFAVCTLESWFFEWVRDELLEKRIDATEVFADYRSLPDRLKGVMREIEARGGLERPFECGGSSEWEEMINLLGVRNGLVHAGASRVGGDLPAGARPPEPTAADLRALAPAEPLRVLRNMASFLTSFADAEPPDWMEVSAANSGRDEQMTPYRIEFKWAAGIGFTWSWSRGVHPRPQTVEADDVRFDGEEYVFLDRDGSPVRIVRKEIVRQIVRE